MTLTKHKEKWNQLGNKTRYFIITGGRGSGKSFEVNRFITMLTFSEGQKVLFTRKTLTSAHISIIPEFVDKIERLGAESVFDINKTEITNLQTGNEILFRGIQSSSKDNTANLKSLQGITCWVLDEAEELTDEETFNRIDLSIRQKGVENRVILILNPATKEHFIYKRFFEDAGVQPGFTGQKGDVTYIHSDYRDNIENLDESFLRRVEYMKEHQPLKYDHLIKGGWLNKAEGVVFENWQLGKFEEPTPPVWGMDFGFSIDPTTLIKISADKKNKTVYVKEALYAPKLTTTDIFRIAQQHTNGQPIYADSAEPRLIEELRKLGLNIHAAVKGPGSVTAGIALLQDYKLIIDPESTNIVKELNNYVWNDKKSSTPIDAYNHALDALRYAATTVLQGTYKNNLRSIASLI